MRRLLLAIVPGALVVVPVASCSVDPALTSGGDGQAAESGLDGTTIEAGGDGAGDVVSEPLPVIDAPSCGTSSVCVDPVPGGWTGPLAVFDQTGGPPAPSAPACPSTYPTDVFDGNASPSAPAAQCGCTCGSFTGATCTGPSSVAIYTGSNCGSSACSTTQLSTCTPLNCNTGNSAKITPPTPSGGSCGAQPSKTVPSWSWTRTGRACQTTSTGAGCSGNSVCVPLPSAPFASTVCILQAGDVACPTSGYTQKFLYYSGVNDTRSCTTCTCSASNLACTGGVVTIWDATGCSGSKTTIAADGQCHGTSGITTVAGVVTTTPTASGQCGASSSSATGSVNPTGPTTVCCAP